MKGFLVFRITCFIFAEKKSQDEQIFNLNKVIILILML